MKIKRKLRVINNSNNSENKLGFIFVSQKNTIHSNKKKIKINITKLYYLENNNYFNLFDYKNKNDINTILKTNFHLNLDNDIIEIINIYNKTIKLYIVILKYNKNLTSLKESIYFDFYKSESGSIYNDIYNYNKLTYKNSYLDLKLNNTKDSIYIKLIDIYYYLIGYI